MYDIWLAKLFSGKEIEMSFLVISFIATDLVVHFTFTLLTLLLVYL